MLDKWHCSSVIITRKNDGILVGDRAGKRFITDPLFCSSAQSKVGLVSVNELAALVNECELIIFYLKGIMIS